MPITEEEAAKITDIVLDQEEIEDTMELFDIRELEFFPNLESLTLRNFDLDNYDFTTFLKLVQLREITFENCDFENSIIIASLKVQSLSLKNCNIKDYNFLYVMDELKECTVNKGILDIQKLNNLVKLEYLDTSYSKIEGDTKEWKLPECKELSIHNTNIMDLTFTLNMPRIQKISISKNQYDANKSVIALLKERNVKCFNEQIVEWQEEVQ